MDELNEYSSEYRKSLDYICFTLFQCRVKSVLIKEKSPHFILGFVKRFFHEDIEIFVDSEESRQVVFKKLGKQIKIYDSDRVDAIVFPFSLETEKEWENLLSNTLKEIKSEFVVVAFRNPYSYKLFTGSKNQEVLGQIDIQPILKKNNYHLVKKIGGLHLKYILSSLMVKTFEKIGSSRYYFKFLDKAFINYFTCNKLLVNLSYIQIIFAREGEE